MSRDQKRIEEAKKSVGSRKQRKRKKHKEKFNRMFSFFFKLYRSGLITFCGSDIPIIYDPEASDAKVAFKEYENGVFGKNGVPITSQPNVLYAVLMGKKGWGLWCDMWAEDIAKFIESKYERYQIFEEYDIELPDAIEREFNNLIWKKRDEFPEAEEMQIRLLKKVLENHKKS